MLRRTSIFAMGGLQWVISIGDKARRVNADPLGKIFLDFFAALSKTRLAFQALRWSLIGNPVKTGDGPAAVTSLLSLVGEENSVSRCVPLF
jgi:hypothetical protein